MNTKEKENQLKLKLHMLIYLSVMIWMMVFGFTGYRIWVLNNQKEMPLVLGNNVPSIKQENLEILRKSIKAVSVNNLPVVRMEPFE